MVPSVVDANCMKFFQQERLEANCAVYTRMIKAAFEKGPVAVDDEGRAIYEYNDCCRPAAVGLNLGDWIADQIVIGAIVYVKMDHSLKKDLSLLGLPAKDLKWPAIAKGAGADLIITEDIDLFDPKKKNASPKQRNRIFRCGGPVSKFLRDRHRIRVSIAQHFLDACEEDD